MQQQPKQKEEILMHSIMESCPAKTVLTGGLGFGAGALFGLVMSSLDTSGLQINDPGKPELTTRQQMRIVARDMATSSFRTAKNFALVGAIYSGVECTIEGASCSC